MCVWHQCKQPCVAKMCATNEWHSFVASMCAWHQCMSLCVAPKCGTNVWHPCVAQMCGTQLWHTRVAPPKQVLRLRWSRSVYEFCNCVTTLLTLLVESAWILFTFYVSANNNLLLLTFQISNLLQVCEIKLYNLMWLGILCNRFTYSKIIILMFALIWNLHLFLHLFAAVSWDQLDCL